MSRRLSVLSAAVVFFGLMACLSSVSCHKKSPTGPSGSLGMVCSASPGSGRVPLPVQFTAKAQGLSDEDQRRVVYNWTLGDGSVASGPTVLKTYIQGGTFNVTMTATYGGDTAVWRTTITVDSDLRVESCSGQPSSGNVPLGVQFQGRVVGNGQNPITYTWDFGDGGTAADAQPSHTYRSAGSYTARLTAQSGGSSAHCSVPVGVFDSLGVTCSASPTSGDAPLTVSFDANVTGGDNACTYSWDFDDGKMSSDQKSPTHRYDLGQFHYPTVTVTCGTRRGSCSQKIKVIGALPTPTPGGGSGTPTPTPTATPTPTPTPVPCPATWSRVAVGTPRLLSGSINQPTLFPPDKTNWDPHCVVKEIKITMHVTTATGFVGVPFPGYTDPTMMLMVCGGGVGFSGCSMSDIYRFSFSAPASGNQIGTTCSDFVLDTAATTAFDPATVPPPYSGTYQWDPGRTGVGDQWYLNGIQYELVNTSSHPPDTILECARIDITTKIVP